MSNMKELYEKVAGDNKLQVKFSEIMKDADTAGEEATKEKLIAFAKEAGYDVTAMEMQEFFKELAESKKGELSDVELDQVAGGKSSRGTTMVFASVFGFGFVCAFASAGAEMTTKGGCNGLFQ